jgi:hypothetical protein
MDRRKMRVYADTTFHPRLYLRLPDSEEALDLMEKARRPASQPLPITWLHRLEIVNALQLHAFTSRQPGQVRITPEQAAAAQATFQGDLAESNFLRRAHVVPRQCNQSRPAAACGCNWARGGASGSTGRRPGVTHESNTRTFAQL